MQYKQFRKNVKKTYINHHSVDVAITRWYHRSQILLLLICKQSLQV